MSDVFVSYAHEDYDRIRPMVEAMRRRKWSVFLGYKDIIPLRASAGDDYLDAQLKKARCVLVLWSKAAAASERVRHGGEHRTLPRCKLAQALLTSDFVISDIPEVFREIQAADLVTLADSPSSGT